MKSLLTGNRIWAVFVGIVVVVLRLGLTVLPAAAKKVIEIGHIDPDEPFLSPDQAVSVVFKSMVEGGTNGEMEVQIFSASVLGKAGESIGVFLVGEGCGTTASGRAIDEWCWGGFGR